MPAIPVFENAKIEWETYASKTTYFEHKHLEECRVKLENKPPSFTDAIDPMSRTQPSKAGEQATEAPDSAQKHPKKDFTCGRGYRSRNRVGRGRNQRRKPYAAAAAGRASPKPDN